MTDEQLLRLVGERVRQLRKDRGLRQEDMCQYGFEYKYYQRIEYGQKNLSLKTLNRLSRAFDIPVSELLDFESQSKD